MTGQKMIKSVQIFLLLILGTYSFQSFALPSAKRLFQSVYGYKVSCQLCHTQGGGSRRNSYGNAFHHAGFDLLAFKKIEELDSDQDGIKNLQEILAKSNPGDTKSIPSAPGDWLQKADEINIPNSELLKIFPDSDQFGGLEGELTSGQVVAAEKILERSLIPEEKVPTYYFSIKNTKKVGVAQVIESSKNHDTKIILGVGISQDGKIHCVVSLKSHSKVSGLEAFLKRLEGHGVETLVKVLDEKTVVDPSIAKDVVNSVRGMLVVMNQVFGAS